MVVSKKLVYTHRKAIFEVTIKGKPVAALFDTGSDKAIWYGTAEDIRGYGGRFKSNDGAFTGIGGSVQYNKPVYTLTVSVYGSGRGITFQDVDFIINDINFNMKQFKIILPFTMFSQFNFRYNPGKLKTDNYGKIDFLVPDNKVLYKVVQDKQYVVSEVYAID